MDGLEIEGWLKAFPVVSESAASLCTELNWRLKIRGSYFNLQICSPHCSFELCVLCRGEQKLREYQSNLSIS